jgi:hypothetical protein
MLRPKCTEHGENKPACQLHRHNIANTRVLGRLRAIARGEGKDDSLGVHAVAMDPAEGDTPRAGDMGPEGDIREVGRETGVVATDRVIDIVGRDRATGDMGILVLPCLHRENPVQEQSNSVLTFRRDCASAETNVHMPMTPGQDPLRLHLRGK